MELQIIGTGSSGNCYSFTSKSGEILIVEAGIKFKEVKKAIDFNIDKIVGVLVSHKHTDHAGFFKDYELNGIKVYATPSVGTKNPIDDLKAFKLGNFTISPFKVFHDVPNLGFQIYHSEMGNTIFATDTNHLPYRFKKIDNILLETNFSHEIMDSRINMNFLLRDRVNQSHMSLEEAKLFVAANDFSYCRNVVLIHLSNSNSNEVEFVKEIKEITGKPTIAARNGMKISLDLPF